MRSRNQPVTTPGPQVPSLQGRVSTRASNKDKHPGNPDKPHMRCRPAEVAESHKLAQEQDREQEQERTEYIRSVAEIEDRYRLEDERREYQRQASSNIKNLKRRYVPDPSDDENSMPASQESLPPRVNRKKTNVYGLITSSTTNVNKLQNSTRNNTEPKRIDITNRNPGGYEYESDEGAFDQTSDSHECIQYGKHELLLHKKIYNQRYTQAIDDENESDNVQVTPAEESESGGAKDHRFSRKNKQKVSRDEVERVRNTHAVSGTPAVNTNKNTNDVDEAAASNASKKLTNKLGKSNKYSGLIPGWDKNKLCVPDPAESSEPEETDGIVRYGGIATDDEAEQEAEKQAAVKKTTKKVVDDDIVTVKPNPLVPKSLTSARQGNKKWANRHLPAEATALWDSEVAPLLRQSAGESHDPWNFPRLSEVQNIIDEVYGDGKFQVKEQGVFYGLAVSRVQGWRRGFVDAAEVAIDTWISGNAEKLNSKNEIAEYVASCLSLTKDGDTSGYHWREFDPETGKRKGFLASRMICHTLGLAHISKSDPSLGFTGNDKPVGALVLATQAVEHTLEQWASGSFVKFRKEFSAENYDNRERLEPVGKGRDKQKVLKKCIDHRTTIFLEAMEQFPDNHWNTIIDEARNYGRKRNKRALKNQKVAPLPEDVVVVEDESCTRPRFMLVEDSD